MSQSGETNASREFQKTSKTYKDGFKVNTTDCRLPHIELIGEGEDVTLKVNLDEIDIDRVKDPATRSYLAIRRLIISVNPN